MIYMFLFLIVSVICLTIMFVADIYFEYKIEVERNKENVKNKR